MSAGADTRTLLELVGVTKRYESSEDGQIAPVLKAIDLQLAPGESVAIVGASGSGKSTLLNIIGTLDRPSEGKVMLDGRDLSKLDEQDLASVRNREIGFIFQLHHLLPQCTVIENVLIPTLAGAPSMKEERESESPESQARRLLERVGLSHRISYRPGQLSGGERQRVAVVRALINKPKLLLADEPTGSLDRTSSENLAQLLVELNCEEGVSLIVVTHANDLASRMSRILELRDGTLSKWEQR